MNTGKILKKSETIVGIMHDIRNIDANYMASKGGL